MEVAFLLPTQEMAKKKKTKKNISPEVNLIHELLLSIGVPPNINGYSYLVSSLTLILEKPEYLHSVTKGLYIDIAKQYHTTPTSVERSMRFAITNAWKYGNPEFIQGIFRNCVRSDKGNPTNSVFLSRLYYYISNMEYYK